MTDEEPQADQPHALVRVEVTNGNDFPIDDYYDGMPILLLPKNGNKLEIQPEVALHCFGYPGEFRDMARHMSKRYGWNSREFLKMNEDRETVFEQFAKKITFKPIYYDLVQRRPSDPIPAVVPPDDEPPQTGDVAVDTGTKVGQRSKKRTPARLGAAPEPRRGRGRATEPPSTADVRMGRK